MLMNLRINPDCLNGKRSWMKNMVQEALDPTNQCKRALMTRILNLLQQLLP
ncbi:hypothetical protein NC652_031062 [Populus alba x Populus x berolinensis]|uniref:Uncharacterized protein n=1 Tax=Populus alba x Populus x berolinensis TaxID=444605 RepID=A0AAD6Q2L4_9ROSI|nr:hypothetical protein NC652_031062 [Populus alba x Populus x berolinensis]KAJ6974858.1 hypothetical protein NC653_030867 [Populus alba x Populus x berolinensis]KAJ6974861.1 hypothetical protein NC653_030870 [Populus alba x Populus x berolinensis]